MRKALAVLLGFISAMMGLLTFHREGQGRLEEFQIGLNEVTWIPALLGILAMLIGFSDKRRSWLAIIAGAVGLGASVWPYMQHQAADEDMDTAMRAGFGNDYEAHIPPPVLSRLTTEKWSLANTLGARDRVAESPLHANVRYAEPDGHVLLMDIYEPLAEPPIGDTYPAIIIIQGGGWRHANRGHWFKPYNHYFASQGYVVFDVQHRLSSVAKWPAQLEDVQNAIRWVKHHAAEYHIDPDRVAMLGRSSGAHLGLMAALRATDAETSVQAVVTLYAPMDVQFKDLPLGSPIVELMNGRFEDMPAAYADASPVEFIRDNIPPILAIEGMMDRVTPYIHGDRLVNRLSMTNTPYALLRVPWSRHGFDAVVSGLGSQLVQYYIDRFLAWSLYGDYHA